MTDGAASRRPRGGRIEEESSAPPNLALPAGPPLSVAVVALLVNVARGPVLGIGDATGFPLVDVAVPQRAVLHLTDAVLLVLQLGVLEVGQLAGVAGPLELVLLDGPTVVDATLAVVVVGAGGACTGGQSECYEDVAVHGCSPVRVAGSLTAELVGENLAAHAFRAHL